MKKVLLYSMVLVIIAAMVMAAGCTGNNNATPTPTAAGTAGATAAPAAAEGFSLTPTAVESVPGYLTMKCDASKDPISAKITVVSRGGDGQYLAKSLNVKTYLSTGQIIEKTMDSAVNTELVFDGTKGTDRVVVVCSYDNGDSYKIFDDVLEYKKRTDNT